MPDVERKKIPDLRSYVLKDFYARRKIHPALGELTSSRRIKKRANTIIKVFTQDNHTHPVSLKPHTRDHQPCQHTTGTPPYQILLSPKCRHRHIVSTRQHGHHRMTPVPRDGQGRTRLVVAPTPRPLLGTPHTRNSWNQIRTGCPHLQTVHVINLTPSLPQPVKFPG